MRVFNSTFRPIPFNSKAGPEPKPHPIHFIVYTPNSTANPSPATALWKTRTYWKHLKTKHRTINHVAGKMQTISGYETAALREEKEKRTISKHRTQYCCSCMLPVRLGKVCPECSDDQSMTDWLVAGRLAA